MRRLFHGRMITVGGHMRRMSENYDLYTVISNNYAQSIIYNSSNPNRLYSEPLPLMAGKTYRSHMTKSGVCQQLIWDYVHNTPISEWTSEDQVFTATAECGVILGVDSPATLKVGDCGIFITEE